MFRFRPGKKWLQTAAKAEEGADIHAGPRAPYVVGFEGSLHPDDALTWACAAVVYDNQLINSVTGRSAPFSDLDRLIQERAVHPTEDKLQIPDYWSTYGMNVIVVSNAALFHHAKVQNAVRLTKTENYHYYLCRDKQALAQQAEAQIQEIIKATLLYDREDPEMDDLLRYGFILNHKHPCLNAMHALVSPNPSLRHRRRRMARMHLE